MLETIHAMQKRCDQSEYAALNFTQIGDYKIGKHLGAGSYASVKQAIHRATGMLTAIKIYDKCKLLDGSRKKAVQREVLCLKKLQHPNLPTLYDVIDSPSQLYLVMEFVYGQNLGTHLLRTGVKQKPDISATDADGNK